MKYKTYEPSDILKHYIKHFAISEVAKERSYKVLPDTGLVMGFQYKGKLSLLENHKQMHLHTSGITGLHDRYRIFENSADIGTVLVYFKETGAASFFNLPIHELFRESVSLDNFMLRSEVLLLEEQLCEEQLCEEKSDLEKVKLIDRFLISKIKHPTPDPLVLAALTLIHKNKGNIRIKDLTKQLHISQSPLEKRFRQRVGTSPKKFASIVRFKHTLRSYSSQTSLTALGYEAGYYDQAHFIKEFRNFAGETPETFFSSKKNDFLQ